MGEKILFYQEAKTAMKSLSALQLLGLWFSLFFFHNVRVTHPSAAKKSAAKGYDGRWEENDRRQVWVERGTKGE